MDQIAHLIKVADAYREADRIEEKTLSHRVFGDSKKLAALRGGADITVGRFAVAMCWLSENWPEGAVWPEEVRRPVPQSEAAA
jgi:hypothetical protein